MKNKIKAFFKSKTFKKVATVGVAMCVMAMSCVMCFATDGTYTPEDAESITQGITSIFQGLTTTFTFANIVKFIGVAISSAGALALGWFGARKVVRMIQTALKKGKVSI